MFKKIYIHNYKCFQNFEFNLDYEKSLLLLGKNGTGKSTLLNIIKLLHEIVRNEKRLSTLLNRNDLVNPNLPIELDFVLDIAHNLYQYKLHISYANNIVDPVIKYEELLLNNEVIYVRNNEGSILSNGVEIRIDLHSIVLSTFFPQNFPNYVNAIFTFKTYLMNMLFLSPIPKNILNISPYVNGRFLETDGHNFCTWLTNILNLEPSLYSDLTEILSKIMPDFYKFKFEDFYNTKIFKIIFEKDKTKLELLFENLSDGEKLFFIFATVIALAKNEERPFFCFWDEPENYISLSLLQSLIQFFRAKIEFSSNNQLFFTSHNPEIMNVFSNANIYYLYRESHLSPTRIKNMQEETDSIVDLLKYGGI